MNRRPELAHQDPPVRQARERILTRLGLDSPALRCLLEDHDHPDHTALVVAEPRDEHRELPRVFTAGLVEGLEPDAGLAAAEPLRNAEQLLVTSITSDRQRRAAR